MTTWVKAVVGRTSVPPTIFAIALPAARLRSVGRASHTTAAAHTKPSGTRLRAIWLFTSAMHGQPFQPFGDQPDEARIVNEGIHVFKDEMHAFGDLGDELTLSKLDHVLGCFWIQ